MTSHMFKIKQKKNKTHDSSMVITQGKGVVRKVEEDKGRINGMERDLS